VGPWRSGGCARVRPREFPGAGRSLDRDSCRAGIRTQDLRISPRRRVGGRRPVQGVAGQRHVAPITRRTGRRRCYRPRPAWAAPARAPGCVCLDSNVRTRLRRPVPNARPGFSSTLQSQIHCLQSPQAALVAPTSLHEPLHDSRGSPKAKVTAPGVVELGFAGFGVAIMMETAIARRSVRPAEGFLRKDTTHDGLGPCCPTRGA
jgi:hypothetical protein